jgi:hypothetical protein
MHVLLVGWLAGWLASSLSTFVATAHLDKAGYSPLVIASVCQILLLPVIEFNSNKLTNQTQQFYKFIT